MSETHVHYQPGVSTVPGASFRQDRKAPPFEALQPDRERYLTIDPSRYTSVEEMRRENLRLWPKVWICAGLVSDLPAIGSWLRFDIGGESFIVARSGAAEFSAFYNVCQHRGNQIVNAPFGTQRSFVCSYHSWAYDLRGRIKHVTDREYFDPKALCGSLDIPRVRCEVAGGMVFINMDDNAPPLASYLGEIAEIFEPYAIEKMNPVMDVVIELDCNWKVVMDAFSEGYHVHMTHPQVLPVADDLQMQIDVFKGGHGRVITPLGLPTSRWPSSNGLNPGLELMLVDAGVDPENFTGGARDIRRACQTAKRNPDNIYGLDYSGFSDSQLTDVWVLDIFPNAQLTLHPEGILVQRFYPHATDPSKCLFHVMLAVPPLKGERRPPFYLGVPPNVDISGRTRPARRRVSGDDPNLEAAIGDLLMQDVRNMTQCQRGMGSRGFKAIRLSEQEQRIQHQFAEIDRYLEFA
jgi:phenylpropionate dioxygenase-like ring-hydroxylating dioxygenase large terminal subunit